MTSSFDYPFDAIESVFATLLCRGILFAGAVAIGLNISSLVRIGRLMEPGGIVAIAITSVGWMVSLQLLAACLVSLATAMAFVISEQRNIIVGWFVALCAGWCSIGLWLC